MTALAPPNGQLSALDLQFDRLSLGGQQQGTSTMHSIPHQLLPVNKLDIPRRRGIVKFFSESELHRLTTLLLIDLPPPDSLKGFGFVVDNDPGALGGQEGAPRLL